MKGCVQIPAKDIHDCEVSPVFLEGKIVFNNQRLIFLKKKLLRTNRMAPKTNRFFLIKTNFLQLICF